MSTPRSHSIQARLLNYSRRHQVNHNHTLTRFANERMMYRISVSPYADRFVLKGAMLFVLWLDNLHRPTQDLDLLGFGDLSVTELRKIFSDICEMDAEDDGIEFLRSGIGIEEIREAEVYQGTRIKIPGKLGNIKLTVSVDVGFGDTIVPEPERHDYPVLLDLARPRMMAYPKETVVAEKVDAILQLGVRNSRMKDYYDLWTLARTFAFEGSLLEKALDATLERRGREVSPRVPFGLQGAFAESPDKQIQWRAFLRRMAPSYIEHDLVQVVSILREFLMPVLRSTPEDSQYRLYWSPGTGWSRKRVD